MELSQSTEGQFIMDITVIDNEDHSKDLNAEYTEEGTSEAESIVQSIYRDQLVARSQM